MPVRNADAQLQSRIRLASIPALDGIRAVAVFLVLFFHLGIVQPAIPFVPGPLGVLGFFVLSGFLITWLLIREQEKTGSISLKGFYRRRALRIFPAFYVFWLIAVGSRWLVHGRSDVPWPQALSAFFYVSNYLHAIAHPFPTFIQHTWSLSAEEQFYLLWPLAFLLFSKKRKLLMLGLTIVIAAIWLHRAQLWMSSHSGYHITYAFDTRADALLVGCLLALALKEEVGGQAPERICRPTWAPVVTILLIGVSVFLDHAWEGYQLVGGLALEPLLVAVLICQLIVQTRYWAWRWLDSKPAVYLGRISYPLYLYHMEATHLASRITAHIAGQSTEVFVASAVVLAVAIASCSYYLVERPFLSLKTRSSAAAAAPMLKMPVASPQTGAVGQPSPDGVS